MFDDIKYLFNNIKKSRRIRGISKVIGDFSNSDVTETMDAKERALNELLELCETDPFLYYVMENYNADKVKLKKGYDKLIIAGAGQ